MHLIMLRRILIFLGIFALLSSVFFATTGLVLAERYDTAFAYSPYGNLGFNPYRLMAYRQILLTAFCIAYVLSHLLRTRPALRLLVALPSLVVIGLCAVLVMSDSGYLESILPEYSGISRVLDNSGMVLLFMSGILLVIEIVFFLFNRRREMLP